ncbi:MAG: LPS export ABC transporter ATP-binding protein [Gammaproteobacteria bacterium]|nr:LPS export ABC transporter ATP-binding protein [Gammaproteobacteria bacterium]
MSTLSADKLRKQFKSRVVVDNISLDIKSGEIVGLLGPNGAGKTTCFYMLVGLIHCDDGNITLDEQNITRTPMHTRAKQGIGYLPQEASIFRGLTVEQNILVSLEARGKLKKSQRMQQCNELLADLQIEHIRDHKGLSLSGGERRRAEIARALAMQPKFILLDEPFAGVDPISVKDIQRILEELRNRDIGLLITDHNVRETLGVCNHAYILNEGRLLAKGTPQNLLSNKEVQDVYLGSNFTLN